MKDLFDFLEHRRFPNGSKIKRLIILYSEENDQIIISVSNKNDIRIKQINRLEKSNYIPVFEADCKYPFFVRRNLYRKLKDFKCTGNKEHKYIIQDINDLFKILYEEMPNLNKTFSVDHMGFYKYCKRNSL